MTRYRKKPIEIEAIHYDGTNRDQIDAFMGRDGKTEEKLLPGPGRGMHAGIVIHTLEGDMTAGLSDWIIRGVQGEFYPCKPDIFAATYEPATEPAHRDGHTGACDAATAQRAPVDPETPTSRQADAESLTAPTDEDLMVTVETALEEQLLPDPGFAVLERSRDAVMNAVAPLLRTALALRDQELAKAARDTDTACEDGARLEAELVRARSTIDRVRNECHAIGTSTCNAASRILAAIQHPDDDRP